MKSTKFVFFLLAVGFSFSFGKSDSSEGENPTKTPSDEKKSQKTDSEPKSTEKNPRGHQQQPEYIVTPDQKFLIEPKLFYMQFANDGSQISPSGFHVNGKQNILLSDPIGRYNLELHNLNRGPATNFQAALGAISGHILSQNINSEYVPYPPNGNPHNYPAYRGHPPVTDPPVVRPYERASSSNYNVQPVDFDNQNPRRLYSSSDYQPGFSNQFQNFYPLFYEIFNDGALYSELRRSANPIQDSRWNNHGEEYLKSIK